MLFMLVMTVGLLVTVGLITSPINQKKGVGSIPCDNSPDGVRMQQMQNHGKAICSLKCLGM
jgi:hypothetical protein